jgi:hypothetical protein
MDSIELLLECGGGPGPICERRLRDKVTSTFYKRLLLDETKTFIYKTVGFSLVFLDLNLAALKGIDPGNRINETGERRVAAQERQDLVDAGAFFFPRQRDAHWLSQFPEFDTGFIDDFLKSGF